MNIQGLNRVTLLDFPGRVACTVFTGGCELRCPFCHNSSLVIKPGPSRFSVEEIFSFLEKRRGILDGVALTGGEPLLQPDIEEFIRKIKEKGYAVKLDTNGCHPDKLERLLSEGLVDYVAMDIKNSPERYAQTVGIPGFDIAPVERSLGILLGGTVDYELRTTAVREFHDESSFPAIGEFISGAKRWFLQNFVDSGALIREGLHGFSEEELRGFARAVEPYVGSADVRGV